MNSSNKQDDDFILGILELVNDGFVNTAKIPYAVAERALEIPYNINGMIVRFLDYLPDGIIYNVATTNFLVKRLDGRNRVRYTVIPEREVRVSIRRVLADMQKEVEFLKRASAIEALDIDVSKYIKAASELADGRRDGLSINYVAVLKKKIAKAI